MTLREAQVTTPLIERQRRVLSGARHTRRGSTQVTRQRSILTAAVLLGAAAVAIPAASSSASGGPSARASRRISQTTCFWTGEVSSKFGIGLNNAFPDSGAVYWTAQITMPAGSWIVFNGRFARALYQSLNTYNVGPTHAPVDALDDLSTKPDRGSTNPFRPGANRDATKRLYTITMYNEAVPAHQSSNTLYAGVAGQASQDIIYRVYLPDSFTRSDLTGGVGLPVPRLHLANGSVQTGQTACRTLDAKTGPLPLSTLPKAYYETLRDQPGKPATFPATPTPKFLAYYNTTFSINCGYYGHCSDHPARIGGQYSNIDNQYISALVNRGFAAGPVLVLHGKLPTTPKTGPSVKRMGAGQLRYWSMCQNQSLYTTIGSGCVYDSEVPVNKQGYYTIVTSLAKDRPKNATAKCGVAWIPWPTQGDGDGHLVDGLLIVRNMLPSASFHHAIQDTTVPGDEQAVLGPYYPRGSYTTKAKFEHKGCPA